MSPGTEEQVREHYRDFWARRGRDPASVKLEADGRPMMMNIGYWDEGVSSARQAQLALVGQLVALSPDLAGQRVLDVGCGVGGPAAVLALDHGAEVDGITIIPEHVELGRRLLEEAGAGQRARLHVGSAMDMPFPDESFDVVFSLEAAHCFPDKERFLGEARRVLRPGGRLVMADITVTAPVPGMRWQPALKLNLLTERQWRRLLVKHGFEIHTSRSIARRVYPGLWAWLGTTAHARREDILGTFEAPGSDLERRWNACRAWALEIVMNRSVLPVGGLLHLRDYTILAGQRR